MGSRDGNLYLEGVAEAVLIKVVGRQNTIKVVVPLNAIKVVGCICD